MMPLLTPSENAGFQNFLTTSVDYNEMFKGDMSSFAMYPQSVPELESVVPRLEGTEHLEKATRDLMALDGLAAKWPPPNIEREYKNMQGMPNGRHQPYDLSRGSHSHLTSAHLAGRPGGPSLSINSHVRHRPSLTIQSGASSSPSSSSSVPSSSKRPFSTDSDSEYPSSGLINGKLGLPSPRDSTRQVSPTNSSQPGLPQKKKPRPTPLNQLGSGTSPIVHSSKPALLSPSQKKANHIQSEQKRRANIRAGYEALCETVPALREAIRVEEEAAAVAALETTDGGPGSMKGKGKARAKRKQSTDDDGAEKKMDGRAGPRSENVVLQKTIDYINDLLSDRSSLLERLKRARSALAPDHPALTPALPPGAKEPLWEREWDGGLQEDNGQEDADDDEDDD